MLFNSMTFLWIFLPLLFLLYFLVKEKYRNYILLIFSLVFYAWGEPKYIVLMLISIVANYAFGILISKSSGKKKSFILALDIVANLGMLAHFKYFNFFVENINGLFGTNVISNVTLPIGISFYTFQIMSYIIDLYRGEIKVQKNVFKLALYISFFPQLIAGPIVKYKDIEEELKSRKETKKKFIYGIKRFTYGLAKKVLLADCLALVADTVFNANMEQLDMPVAWIGAICYMLQIFFDFSGYSDMAIGLGSMFGFTFPENFNLPYISKSITEFWRRWHISLSTWFKEYLYIPLGGNRKGRIRTYINLWIVFLATGIWHGAAWTFIIWGVYQGIFIFIERLGFKKFLDRHKKIGIAYTLMATLIGWVIFRANNVKAAIKMLLVMFIPSMSSTTPMQLLNEFNHRTLIVLIIAILLSGPIQVLIERVGILKRFRKRCSNYLLPITTFFLLLVCILCIINETYSTFIYFRF